MNRQSELLQHITPIYLNHQHAQYAKELTDRMPGDLKVGRGPILPDLGICREAPGQLTTGCKGAHLIACWQPQGGQGSCEHCSQTLRVPESSTA